MNLEEQNLLKEFKVNNLDELFNKKQKEKQGRTLSVKKPSKVVLREDECKRLCGKYGIEYLSGYESRVLQYTTTNEARDRYGDIVRAKGADLASYKKNPVIMLAHNYQGFPVGASINIWINTQDRSIPAWGLFFDDRVDISGRSELTFKFGLSGGMKACSIGFIPKESYRPSSSDDAEKMGLGKYGVEYLKWEYLEWSPCGIPANPEALQNWLKNIDRKTFNSDDVEKAVKSEFFKDMNLLDMFRETVNKNIGKNFSIPPLTLNQDAFDSKEEAAKPEGTWKYCVCDECGYYTEHKAGEPCEKCKKCGTQMHGSDTKPKKNLITCQNCQAEIDYDEQEEISMGAIECPSCKFVLNQEGEIHNDYDKLFEVKTNDKDEFENNEEYEQLDNITLEYVEKPYPNEHSARLRKPTDFNPNTFRRTAGGIIYGSKKVPKTIGIIWGKLKGKDKPSDPPVPQALRFEKNNWSIEAAKKWLKDNNIKYILFEPASGKDIDDSKNQTVVNLNLDSLNELTNCVKVLTNKMDSLISKLEKTPEPKGASETSDDGDDDIYSIEALEPKL